MFCETTVDHQDAVDRDVLVAQLHGFGSPIKLSEAYSRSAIYKKEISTRSVYAFESGSNCFVIFRRVTTNHFSIYHLEGNTDSVTVPTMLEAAQQFVAELSKQLSKRSLGAPYKVRELSLRLFEDNGKEIGLVGKPFSIGAVLKEKLAWKEISPPIITFVTAALLFWRGLNDKPLAAAGYSFAVVVLFIVLDTVLEYRSRRGKIEWKFSWK